MAIRSDDPLANAINQRAHPLTDSPRDFDPIMDLVGEARFVMIGEASHGTHEFYAHRAALTRRLIVEKGFSAVAVEADWPDAHRVNRFVQGVGSDFEAVDALSDFQRFPAWMWRNADVLDFVGWMREFNDVRPETERVGFYGLDLYSLHASARAVIAYLEGVDPAGARRARERYACLEQSKGDPQAYGYMSSLGLSESCELEAVRQLVELQAARNEYLRANGAARESEFFSAEQNARLVKDAEEYYRTMFHERVSSWNLRDEHMADTLARLVIHLDRRFGRSKIVVWAHNSHIGDARATEMGDRGELNIGQLVRERFGAGQVVLVGFSTHRGTVTAASDWGAPAERMRVPPGMPDSYEALFHETGLPGFLLNLRNLGEIAGGLHEPRLQRAIGVVYRPLTERFSHYFHARVPQQFDAIIHLDETRAVEPLERAAEWERGEAPETFPTGI